MPWGSVRQPSLQLGILCSRLEVAGIQVQGLYANLEFAERVGLPTYEEYSSFHNFISDWLFSEVLFPCRVRDPRTREMCVKRFYAFATENGCSTQQLAEVGRLKNEIPDFVEWICHAVDWSQTRVVGFSTTMLQPVSSLAIARVLKERYPHLRLLFGGAGCAGPMGRALHRNFPFVDGVVDGEADLTIAPLVKMLLQGDEPKDIPGLIWRDAMGSISQTLPQPSASLKDYPIPSYKDYFEQLQLCTFAPEIEVRIPFEASRGCWWAVRSHCLFCGLNGQVIKQRSRSAEEVVLELKAQRELHRANIFVATDNIMDPGHLVSLPRQIERDLPRAELFFEVRAVMTRAQMSGLARGGFIHLQPGLESLVPEVLAMVKKGTTPIINLCFLRRSLELGVNAYWNLLYGFPGEQALWYDELLVRLPQVFHLPRPDVVEFSLERFSPYFDQPEEYQIRIKGPLPGYRLIWDLPDEEIEQLCFNLDFEAPGLAQRRRIGEQLRAAVADWAQCAATFTMKLLSEERVQVIDSRPLPGTGIRVMERNIGLVLRAFEEPLTVERASKRLLASDPRAYLQIGGELGFCRLADSLVRDHLLFCEGEKYLCLAVPESEGFWALPGARNQPAFPSGRRLEGLVGKSRNVEGK
jgi:ribosomal peptide maturation radical SAM protein 1